MRLRIEAKNNDVLAVVSANGWRDDCYALMARMALRDVREFA